MSYWLPNVYIIYWVAFFEVCSACLYIKYHGKDTILADIGNIPIK